MSELADNLAGQFLLLGYEWNFEDGKRVPTSEDIQQALARMREVLYNDEEAKYIEMGRLVLKREAQGDEVYLYMGDL